MIDEKKFYSAGFTLVELIIVISVLAVLSMVGIAAFASYSRAQTLNAAAGDLSVMLNLAKSRAYSQIKPVICGDNSLEGYEVRICGSGIPSTSCVTTTSEVDYELDVRCGGPFPIATATFSNLNFAPSIQPPVYSFFFPVLKGGVVGNGTITVGSDNFSETREVTVDESGNIRIEK